jgi:hypothetical protein
MPRRIEKVIAIAQVGGLHHRYERLDASVCPGFLLTNRLRGRPVRGRLKIYVSGGLLYLDQGSPLVQIRLQLVSLRRINSIVNHSRSNSG